MFAYQIISFVRNYSPCPNHTNDLRPIYGSVVLSDPFPANTLVKALSAAVKLGYNFATVSLYRIFSPWTVELLMWR